MHLSHTLVFGPLHPLLPQPVRVRLGALLVGLVGVLERAALAASGLMNFAVVGHSQRAMEQAQNSVRAAFIGLALMWGAPESSSIWSPALPGKQGCTEHGG